MRKHPLVFLLVVLIPLVLGFGIGYSIRPSAAATAGESQHVSFESTFPSSVNVQNKHSQDLDQITESRQNAITRAVAKVSPATVGINVTEIREQPGLFQVDPMFRRFFGEEFWRGLVGPQRYQVRNLGSGVIISPDGYIVTNYHVAGNASEITVTFVGGERMKAELVGADELTDIALLKVNGKDLPYANLGNSDDVIIGEWAIALGNPFGLFEINDKPTVTVGVISSVGMNLGRQGNSVYRDMIETDAAINQGNSGGPLVNSRGEVVGINTIIFTGGVSQAFVGYGFAIPVNKMKKVTAELRKRGKVVRDIWTGFESQVVDARIARYFGLSEVQGVIVSDIYSKSPAERAGMKVGDIILAIDGDNVNSEEELFAILSDANPGDVLKLKIYRERKLLDLELKLERKS